MMKRHCKNFLSKYGDFAISYKGDDNLLKIHHNWASFEAELFVK